MSQTRLSRRSALIFASTLAAGALTSRAVRPQTLTPLRVGTSLDDGLTPALYALRTGIFRAHGLDVTLIRSQSGAALSQAVASGVVDVARAQLMPLITAYTRGIRFTIVVGSSEYLTKNPTSELCVLRSSPIRSLAQAGGKVIVTNALQSLDQLGIEAMVDKAGGDWQSVKFFEMPSPAMLAALEEGRADIASITNPSLQAAIASGKVRTLGDSYGGIAPRLLIAGWFTTAAFAKSNPATVQRFHDAVVEAARYTNTHHDATIQMMADFAHLDPDVIRQMNRIVSATTLDPSMIQPSIDAAARYKLIPQPFSAKELLP